MPPCIERTSIEGKRISLACVPPSVLESARVVPWTSQGKGLYNYYERLLKGLAKDLGFSLTTPWNKLDPQAQEAVLRGNDYEVHVRWKNRFGRDGAVLQYRTRFDQGRYEPEGTEVKEQLIDERVFRD